MPEKTVKKVEKGITEDGMKNIGFSEFNLKDFNKTIPDFDVLKIDKALTDILNTHNITLITKKLSGGTLSGEQVILKYKGVDQQGVDAFSFMRKFTKGSNGLTVTHEELWLAEKYQNKNISRKVLSIFYDEYTKMGIQKIYIHAGDKVGGYAWAKAGFEAVPETKDYLIQYAYDQTSANNLSFGNYMKFTKYLESIPDGQNIPMFEIANMPFGKELLLGTDWKGSLNLNNPISKQLFESYINK
jgi:hypothetical protein